MVRLSTIVVERAPAARRPAPKRTPLGRRIDAFRQSTSGFLVTHSRLGEGDVGIDSQCKRFLLPFEAVVVTPVSTAVWVDQQIQAAAVGNLSRLTQRLHTANFQFGQHLSSGAMAVAAMRRPVRVQ